MKKLMMLIFLLILTASSISYSVKLVNSHFEINQLYWFTEYKGKVAVRGYSKDLPGYFDESVVFLFENGKWRRLPEKVYNGKDSSAILGRIYIGFDSLGTIWVTGHSLYGFKDNRWHEYYVDDEYRDYRIYDQFVVDIYNNLWISSWVYNREKNIQFSEIYKFDGKRFKRILKYDYVFAFLKSSQYGCEQCTMSALPDGRIVIYRNMSRDYPDFNEEGSPDIVFFNQDGSFTTSMMISPSGEKYNNYDKRVSDIFAITADSILFSLNIRSFMIDSQSWGHCCSGMSMYANGRWYPFNEENGLYKITDDVYVQICKIIEYQKDKFLLIDKAHLFYMDKTFQLKELSWDDILPKSEFFVCHSYYFGEKGEKYIHSLTQKPDTSIHARYVHFVDDILMPNGDIWLLTDIGIFKFNPDIIADIEDNETEESNLIYPNPAKNYISILSNHNFNKFNIYNYCGRLVDTGKLNLSKININKLSAGLYFIRLMSADGYFVIKSFVKY